MEKFNESLPFDRRMWAEDIRVSGVLGMPRPRACDTAVADPNTCLFRGRQSGVGGFLHAADAQPVAACGSCVPHVHPH